MIRLLTFAACIWGSGASAQDLAAPAETADFQQRGTPYGPLMDFVDQLESHSDLIYLQTLTENTHGAFCPALHSLGPPRLPQPGSPGVGQTLSF